MTYYTSYFLVSQNNELSQYFEILPHDNGLQIIFLFLRFHLLFMAEMGFHTILLHAPKDHKINLRGRKIINGKVPTNFL